MIPTLQLGQFGRAGTRATVPDVSFASVVLLAPLSVDFDDVSSYGRTATVSGPTINSTQTLFGLSTGEFGGGVTYPDAASLDIGTQNFCVEGWLYLSAYPGGSPAAVCAHSYNTSFNWTNHEFIVFVQSDGQMGVTIGNGGGETKILSGTGSGLCPTNTWFHWAACRGGGTLDLYRQGARRGSGTLSDATSINASTAVLRIAGAPTDSPYVALACRQAQVRHTIGSRRYTGTSYVEPSAPFPTV